MKIVSASIRRPVTVFIFAVAAVVFGLVAFRDLATDLLPDITYPSITIRTGYPGAAPAEVESLVTRPIEEVVGVVNNVVRETSSSRADLSEVTLEFGWDTNMDLAALDVRERLDVLRLPDGVERPVLLRYDPSLDPILRIGVTGPDLIHLRRIAEEELKRPIERQEGVAAVVVSGGLEEEIQVEINERRLANLGLSIDRIVARLGQENINLTGGRLLSGQAEMLVRTVNEVVRPEELLDVVIDSSQGAVVRLRDVARVRRGNREREIITRIDGVESVEIAVYKEGGTNTVTVSDRVREQLEPLRERLAELDPDLELTLITDQARFIRQSVREVLQTALWGGLLAILVLYLFLRSFKTTAIIAAAIPISVVATFFLMYVSGISLNIMSLGGLTLGIGLLVDNSIVVLEAIQRKRDRGMGEAEAADAGASEVAQAVVASTLTTICVFVPILFVEGVAAQLFADQALTVTFSLVVSLFVALTVIPMLASRRSLAAGSADDETDGPAEPSSESAASGPFAAVARVKGVVRRAIFVVAVAVARTVKLVVGGIARSVAFVLQPILAGFALAFDALSTVYAKALGAVLRRPLATVAATLLLLALSLTLYPRLGRVLVPELVQGEIFVTAQLPPGTRLEVTERQLADVERAALGEPGVRTVYAVAGTSNEQGGGVEETRENVGQVTVLFEPPTTREREEALISRLRTFLDGKESFDYRFGRPSFFSFRTPVEVEIRGYNLTLLERLASDLVGRMRQIPGLVDIRSSTEGGNPEVQVRFLRDRLATFGLTVQDVASVLRAKVLGDVATDLYREDRQIDVRVRSREEFRDSLSDLGQLVVAQRGKTAIPLASVAVLEMAEGPAEIRRTDGERVARITANLADRDLDSVSRDIIAALEAMDLPAGFDWQMGGQRQEMETSFDSMRLAFLLALFMVYLVMASQFESLLHPLVILFSIPFSLIGVLATLYLADVTVSVVVLIGVILLAGIVVNNAIILIDYTNQLRREGMSKIDALHRAGGVRLRPILMTTATTVLGLVPMAIGLGEGNELRTPMALTVIGGLLTSTALTLLIIPAVYTLLDRRD